MKSVKPGRGPSFMGGVMSLFVGCFGVVWTIAAYAMGGGLFALFGVIFVATAVVMAVFHFKNATGKSRYSSFDIVDGHEEIDPWNARFGEEERQLENRSYTENAFCPYCGTPVEADFEFCRKCGRKLP